MPLVRTNRKIRHRPSKYGPQPAIDLINARDLTLAQVVEWAGLPYTQVYNAITGVTVPSYAVRNRLPVVLDVELSELFNPDVLAMRPWVGRRGRATS